MRNDSGFTITELLVSLVIGTLVISGVYTLLLFSQRIHSHWQKNIEDYDSVNRIVQMISYDICRTKNMVMGETNIITLKQVAGGIVEYEFNESSVRRNSEIFENVNLNVEILNGKVSIEASSVKNNSNKIKVLVSPLQSAKSNIELMEDHETTNRF